jgi:hypothetical protein
MISEAGGGRAFVDELFNPYTRVFQQIQASQTAPAAHSDPLALHLYYLGRLSGQEWYPAALSTLKVYGDSPETTLSLIRGIDRVAHVTRILCHGSGRRATRFGRIVKAILAGEARDETAEVFSFTRDEMRNAKFHLRNLHRRNPPVCKLLLMRINDHIAGSVTLADPKDLSVEHILPNRPAAVSEWRQLFPEPEVREAVTQCLGNYTLLPETLNDRMRNREFSEKQKQIGAHFGGERVTVIVADVIDAVTWDYETVVAREQKFLAVLGGILGIDVRDAGLGSDRNAAE